MGTGEIMVYITTTKSKQIIKDAHKAEKNGVSVDWEDVFKRSQEASANGKDEAIKAIAGRNK